MLLEVNDKSLNLWQIYPNILEFSSDHQFRMQKLIVWHCIVRHLTFNFLPFQVVRHHNVRSLWFCQLLKHRDPAWCVSLFYTLTILSTILTTTIETMKVLLGRWLRRGNQTLLRLSSGEKMFFLPRIFVKKLGWRCEDSCDF